MNPIFIKILQKMRLWLILLACLFVFIAGLTLVSNYFNSVSYDAQYQEYYDQYQDLQDEYDRLTELQNQETTEFYSVATEGAEIARLEEEYNNTWNTDDDDIYKSQLEFYLPADSLLWYQCKSRYLGISMSWQFMTTWMQSDPDIDSTWICYDDQQHEILCYVTAVYDAIEQTFDNVKIVKTVKGMEYEQEAEMEASK